MGNIIETRPWPPFKRSGTSILTRTANDKVGIGVTSVSAQLDVDRATVGAALAVTSSATTYTNGGATLQFGRTGNLTGLAGETFNCLKVAPVFQITDPDSGAFEFFGAKVDASGLTASTAPAGVTDVYGLHITGPSVGRFRWGLYVSGDSNVITSSAAAPTNTVLSVTGPSLTTGTNLLASSSSNVFTSGKVLSVTKTATTMTAAMTGDVANITWTGTTAAALTLNHTANALDVSRAITSNHADAVITVSGALVTLNSTNVQTLGTLTDTGNILSLTQGYASASGDVLTIANSGTGKDINGTSSSWYVSKAGAAYFTGKLSLDSTVTPGGTTGDQTIDKPSGTVNIAAEGSSVTVTNSFCVTTSIVLAVVRTADATATIKNVVPGAGSFVITLGAAATAETSIGFIVIN